MIEVFVVVAIVKTAPLGNLLNNVGYSSFFCLWLFNEMLDIVANNDLISTSLWASFVHNLAAPHALKLLFAFRARITFFYPDRVSDRNFIILFVRWIFFEIAIYWVHAFFKSESERRSAIDNLKVFLADVDKVAHRIHIAVYEGRENGGVVRDISAFDWIPLSL